MKHLKLNLGAIIILVMTLLSTWRLPAQTNFILSDPFTGDAGALLSGTAPQDHGGIGADPWIEANNDMILTGTNCYATNGGNENAFQAFTPSAGSIYVLSADLNPFATQNGDWFAIGFSQNDNDGQWHNAGNNASGWILARGTGAGQTGQTFLGPETTGGGGINAYYGLHTYSIVLDTTLVNWTFQFFVDGVSVRGPAAYSSSNGVNPTINFVGFGHLSGVGGTVDNFSLATVPQIRIQDPFTGDAGALLSGTTPQSHGGTGADAWIEANNDMILTGTNCYATNGGNENAFLPFTPANGAKYLLSADLNPFATQNGDWFAVGFSQNDNDGQWHNSGNNASGWILARGTGAGQTGQTFLGPETTGGGGIAAFYGLHTYSVELDTTLVNWTFQFFVDGVSVRGPAAYSSSNGVNPTINFVGFGHLSGVGGTVDNFTVETIFTSGSVGPSVAKQPVDATVVVGGNADFSASVAGTPPLSFQWLIIAGGTTNVLAGQTSDTLQLTGLSFAANGNKYALVVTNLYGTVTSRGAALTVLNVPGPLVHKFSFNDGTPNDSVGGITGALYNGAAIVDGELYLDSLNSIGHEYAQVGPYVVPPSNATVVAWFNTSAGPSGLSPQSRVFDFGSDITSYLYFSPAGTGGTAQAGLRTAGGGGVETTVFGAAAIDDGLDHKIAVVVDSTPTGTGVNGTMFLYIDDTLAGSADLNGDSLTNLAVGPQNYFGLSQDITDSSFKPPFNGTIDQIDVFNTALSQPAIAALTPDTDPTSPPVIITQPVATLGFIGGLASFSVTALGPPPQGYLWELNGVPIANSDTNVLDVTDLQSTNFGGYTVIVTNTYGSVTSVVAQLSVSAWSYAGWTNDASSGIDNRYYYTDAYDFGGANVTVAGVPFTGVAGPNPSVSNVFTVTGEANASTDAGNNIVGTSTGLATAYIFNGTSGALTLDGLVPGSQYLLSLFGVDPDASGIRTIQFTGNGGQKISVNEDSVGQGNGIVVSYQYTASPSGTVTITDTAIMNSTFNWYGFANRELEGPALQIISSGSKSVTISWSGFVAGYTLKSSPALGAAASWTAVSGVQLVGGLYQVTVPANGTMFYQLQQ
jgi:hypothetical protein